MSLSLPDWSITKKAPAVSTTVRKDKNSPLRALFLAPASAHSAFPTVSRLPVFLQDDRPSRGCSCRHWPFHHGCPTLRRKASSQLQGSWDRGVGDRSGPGGRPLSCPRRTLRKMYSSPLMEPGVAGWWAQNQAGRDGDDQLPLFLAPLCPLLNAKPSCLFLQALEAGSWVSAAHWHTAPGSPHTEAGSSHRGLGIWVESREGMMHRMGLR